MGSGASIGDVTGKLTLDSAEFDSKLKASGEGLDRHAALTEKASERARKAWEKELVAQANAQRATEQAARAKELAALKADILSRSTETLEHATVSQMQATSAAVRSFEGNPGIRAVERFLTTIPGVGQALQAAFPLVGALAFGGIIVDMGEKIAEFAKKVREMPRAIEQGFGSLNLAQRTSIDQLDLANDKLQNAIDKMAKKPENNVKVAFDEAKLSADRLATSIENDNNRLNELLSKNHLSGWAVLFGEHGTAEREGTTKAFGDQADRNAFDLADAESRGDTAGVDKAKRALKATQDALLANMRGDLAKRISVQPDEGNPDDIGKLRNTANIKLDEGVITNILNQQREQAAQTLNAQKEAEKQLADDKKAAEKQLADDKKAAAEQAKQAAAKRLQDFEAQLAAQKLALGDSVKLDYEFWQQKQAAFRAGSEQHNAIVAKQAQLAVEGARQAHAKIEQFQKQQDRAPSQTEGDEFAARGIESISKGRAKDFGVTLQDYVDTNQLSMLKARNDARQAEAELTDESGRSMTKYAAALELAAVHAREFKAEMMSLEGILNTRALAAGSDPSRENNKALSEAQGAIVEAQAKRQLQVRADDTAINGRDTSPLVGASDALRDFINATRDGASQMRDFTDKALSGFNAEAVKAISGQRTSFGDFGAGLGRDVAGAALKKGEGSIIDMLPWLGGDKTKKPAGTPGDPLHVFVANIQAMGGAPKLPNILPDLDAPLSSVPFSNFLPGGGGGTMPSIGSLLGTALEFLPGFASGGAIDPDQWAIVGEDGPELFHSGGGGTIVPNSKIGDMGGGGDTHFHVDARGSSDPAAVEAAVRRGIKAAAPHIAAAGVRASAEQKMRGPASKR